MTDEKGGKEKKKRDAKNWTKRASMFSLSDRSPESPFALPALPLYNIVWLFAISIGERIQQVSRCPPQLRPCIAVVF